MVSLLVSVAESALHKVASKALNSFVAHHFTRKPHTPDIRMSINGRFLMLCWSDIIVDNPLCRCALLLLGYLSVDEQSVSP